MKRLTTYILSAFIIVACSEEEPVAEAPGKPPEPKKRYRTYKRAIPMMKSDRMNLERAADLENAQRYILKTFDSYKSDIQSSPNSK